MNSTLSDRHTCPKCSQSFPRDHFLGRGNRACKYCASCRGAPTEGLSAPFSPLPPSSSPAESASAAPPATSNVDLATTLPPALTEASPAFLALQQRLDDQASSLSGIATTLQQLLEANRCPQATQSLQPTTQPVVPQALASSLPTAAPPASGQATLGESRVNRLFPWIPREVVQQVLDDTLPPQDLGKLRNPDKLSVPAVDENAIIVNGVRVSAAPAPSTTTPARSFIKLVPDVRSFAQAWTIYAHLRACATNDPNLGACLGAFLVHVLETDCSYVWPSVAGYILAVCRRRFGHSSPSVWSSRDTEAWQDHLSDAALRAPRKSPPSVPSTRPASSHPNSISTKRAKSTEICYRFNWTGCPEKDSCWRLHECTNCRGHHSIKDCPTRPANFGQDAKASKA